MERKVDLNWDKWYHQIFYAAAECDDSAAVVSVGHRTDHCMPLFLKDSQESFKPHGSQRFEYIDSGATVAKYTYSARGCPSDNASDPSAPRKTVLARTHSLTRSLTHTHIPSLQPPSYF
jgi:hypothetical protein